MVSCDNITTVPAEAAGNAIGLLFDDQEPELARAISDAFDLFIPWSRLAGRPLRWASAVTAALSMPVSFCAAHHPWQHGTNENTERLLRQYLHKNADLSALTPDGADCRTPLPSRLMR